MINCNFLTDRFQLQPGVQVTLSHLIMKNCRTYSVFGFLRKLPGSLLALDYVVDDRGPVCVTLQLMFLADTYGIAPNATGLAPVQLLPQQVCNALAGDLQEDNAERASASTCQASAWFCL